MGYFLYHIPDIATVGQAALDRVGLSHLAGMALDKTVSPGPLGNGMLFTARTKWRKPKDGEDAPPDPRVQYRPDAQMWFRAGPDGPFSFGYWNDDPPTPDDLLRNPVDIPPTAVGITMADGRDWYIPQAELAPVQYQLQADGTVGESPEAVDRAVWELARDVAGHFMSEHVLSVEDCAARSACAFTRCYHVGLWELHALGVLSGSTLKSVCMVVTGLKKIREIEDSLIAQAEEVTEKKRDKEAPDTPT